MLDSEKTLICLRNACHFVGSPVRQKGRSFLFTDPSFIQSGENRKTGDELYQWRIGSFLSNCSCQKKIRSRNKKINFGSNQEPDCVVLLDADRKFSVMVEADRSQIPIASSVDSTIRLGSHCIFCGFYNDDNDEKSKENKKEKKMMMKNPRKIKRKRR